MDWALGAKSDCRAEQGKVCFSDNLCKVRCNGYWLKGLRSFVDLVCGRRVMKVVSYGVFVVLLAIASSFGGDDVVMMKASMDSMNEEMEAMRAHMAAEKKEMEAMRASMAA